MDSKELLHLHDEITARCKGIMERKNSDYTGGKTATDALSNFKGSKTLGIHPVMGLLLRVQDKMKRIESFVADGELRVQGEPVQDACDDCVNYFILAAALLKEEAAKLGTTEKDEDLTSLPADYVQVTDSAPLYHRPSESTDDILVRTRAKDWVSFTTDCPTYADFAVRKGSAWATVNEA